LDKLKPSVCAYNSEQGAGEKRDSHGAKGAFFHGWQKFLVAARISLSPQVPASDKTNGFNHKKQQEIKQ